LAKESNTPSPFSILAFSQHWLCSLIVNLHFESSATTYSHSKMPDKKRPLC